MTFQPGDWVSLVGFGVRLRVVSASGDDVTVLEYDPRRKTWRQRTYKAAMLRPAPRRQAMGVSF